ncbi:hypothetical protein EV13_2803 [Prochlorococcus sp. MIT 0702]|nr:hypothetical protein EV13_2803 [Prochlorococcus sp. MIT 0702]
MAFAAMALLHPQTFTLKLSISNSHSDRLLGLQRSQQPTITQPGKAR